MSDVVNANFFYAVLGGKVPLVMLSSSLTPSPPFSGHFSQFLVVDLEGILSSLA